MEISNRELEFDSIDRFGLKTFLATRAGTRLVPKIFECCPVLLSKGEINEILIKTGEVRGFAMAIQALLSLAEPPPKEAPPERTAYPPLDADDQWNDGQSLTEKK